jgi:hypothetical protein
MNTSDVRKALKKMGYRLKLRTSSLGTHIGVIHVESNTSHGSVCFPENYDRWTPFNQWADANIDQLEQWQAQNRGFFGVKSWFTRHQQ